MCSAQLGAERYFCPGKFLFGFGSFPERGVKLSRSSLLLLVLREGRNSLRGYLCVKKLPGAEPER